MKYLYLSKDMPAIVSALGIQSYKLKDTIFDVFMGMDIQYPKFEDWYGKVFVETFMDEVRREIILAVDNEKIVGLLILKDFGGEKKVCTLVVIKEYRKQGIASKLFELSFEYLGTMKPSFTVSQKNVPGFSGLIRKFRFKLTDIDDTVNKDQIEFFYN